MGWWDSLWPSSSGADDPLGKLDPKLREFLEKESPVKYNSAAHSQPTTTKTQTQPIAAQSQATQTSREEGDDDNNNESKPALPKESQFQDGRYAHLWKTYRPLAEVEAETKSDHERLMDVLEAYKERKNQIGKAALENCALEQVDWRSCMMNPSLADRMTMCRDQVRKFERCYMMQTRFLKALGYLSSYDRSPEVEEEIQLHADKLYHRMLEQEAEVEKAKAEGRPIPKFTSPIPPPHRRPAVAAATAADLELTPEQQETLRARLEKVPEEDRAAEAEAIKAEWRAKAEIASRVQGLWRQQEEDRRARKERGEQTMWDKVAGAFGGGGGDGEGKK
ncbi:hypothetical protein DL766_002391 [Monosporascus sp. MC13-8B]|uniref:Autophagy protein n=1 Tax=Monosporascus cannonballus TaxID=155416 RepID=A0ABY0HCP2_9PEZI|nr:hypothetical protein DL762_004142 [Monosporascus cannonballus]RYO97096.1 hypothetical protein DL763_002886 [Monosporascus cannonballus]RYP35658.1 hypothetical protein DL766_002391 [Monosporascus sp. MC13-8B]